MTFQVPASRASQKQNQFEFQIPGSDRTYSLPKLQYIRPSVIRDVAAMPEQQAFVSFIDYYLPDVIQELDDAEQLGALINAWQEASGISLGESGSSTPSPSSMSQPSGTSSSESDSGSTTSGPTSPGPTFGP